MSKRRVVLAAVALATVALAISAAGAAANPYSLRFCTTESNMPEHPAPWDWHDSSAWSLSNLCPRAYVLTMNGTPQSPGDPGAWYTLGPFSDMESVSVTLRGDDGSGVGITQGVRVCDTTLLFCGRLNMPSGAERVVMRRGTPDFPNYPGRFIVIDADCHLSVDCPAAGDLEISDLEIGGNDDSPPRVVFPATDARWHNSDFPFDVTVDDVGTGVHRVDAPGLLPSAWESGCADIDARIVFGECMADLYLPPTVDTSEFAQGANTFDFTAFDGAGNSTSRQVTYKFDSVAPPAPAELRAVGGEHAWLASTHIVLNWRNDGETVASHGESGLQFVNIDVDPAGDEPIDPLPVSTELTPSALSETTVNLPGEGRWIAKVSLTDAAGNTGESTSLLLQVDPTRPPTPRVSPIGFIGSDAVATGFTVIWPNYIYGAAGNCGFTHAINTSPSFQPSENLSSGALTASPWRVTPEALAALPDGRQYFHLRSISCAGVPSAVSHEPFLIDRLAPDVQITPRSGWHSDDSHVELIATETGDAAIKSAVDRIEYIVDGGPTQTVGSSSYDLALTPGEHRLDVRAFDRAGNESTTQTARVGFDPDAPDVRIARPAANAPTDLRVAVADATSGVSEAWIDVRPANGGSWRRIGTRLRLDSPGAGSAELAASIPDDGGLPDGGYRLRVVAIDAAGNTAIATTWADGEAAQFSLPLRPRPSMRLLVDGKTVTRSITIDHHRGRTITGLLTQQGAGGVEGADLSVVETRPGGVAREVQVIKTKAGGRFSYFVKPEVSRRIEFRYAGTSSIGCVAAALSVRTRAGISLHAERRLLRGDGVTRLTGRVDLSRAALPAHPFFVVVELLSVKGKRFEVPVASDGSFVLSLSYRAKSHPIRLRYRAATSLYPDWPFAQGLSRVATIVVSQ